MSRLLSIGEFSSATQLSAKALRLYDEQRLLLPAKVDAITGYRYYRPDQIAAGRFIRMLRSMDLPLAQIARIVTTDGERAEQLLVELAHEADRRYALEKRAFQAALASMRQIPSSDTPEILVGKRRASTVSVHPFAADQQHFLDCYRVESARAREALDAAGISIAGLAYCSLLDPLSDEEGRLELLIPLVAPAGRSRSVTLRHLPDSACLSATLESRSWQPSDLTAVLDAMFDWLDRHGHVAGEPPALTLEPTDAGQRIEISWACTPTVSAS
jgi:DNA-binding transcriptional MerR regulator